MAGTSWDTMLGHVQPTMTKKRRDEHDRRLVIMCAVGMRPFNMLRDDSWKHFIGGLSGDYASQTIHPTSINKIMKELCEEVNARIAAVLKVQHTSVTKLGWSGPFVSIQVDMTTTHDVEYCTVSLSLVPEDWRGMERLAVCTKSFPGKHTAGDVEPWIRKVFFCRARNVFLSWTWLQAIPKKQTCCKYQAS